MYLRDEQERKRSRLDKQCLVTCMIAVSAIVRIRTVVVGYMNLGNLQWYCMNAATCCELRMLLIERM